MKELGEGRITELMNVKMLVRVSKGKRESLY